MLLDGPSTLFVGAREQDRDRVQVITGQAAEPVLRCVGAGVAEDAAREGMPVPELVREGRSDSSGTPSARSPFQVNASVTQRSDSSIVATASAADCVLSSSSDSHARPPSGVSNERNS